MSADYGEPELTTMAAPDGKAPSAEQALLEEVRAIRAILTSLRDTMKPVSVETEAPVGPAPFLDPEVETRSAADVVAESVERPTDVVVEVVGTLPAPAPSKSGRKKAGAKKKRKK